MTLVELMIAFLLTTILCVTAMSVTSNLVGDVTSANTRIGLNSEAQLVMDGISRQIRAATYAANGYPSLEPVAYASANEITFYASLLPNSLGSGPVKFDIKASGRDLVETTWQPDAGSGGSGWTYTTPGVAQTLATDVDESHVLFTYYGCPPLEQECPQVDLLTDPGDSLTGQLPMTQENGLAANGTGMIHAVMIDLWLDPSGAGNRPYVEVTTTVHLINVDFTNPLTS
jgi:type II secretory pathway pseudopilin PulG